MLFWTFLDLWLPLSLAYANGQGTEMLLVEMNLAWTCAITLDSNKPRNHKKAARVSVNSCPYSKPGYPSALSQKRLKKKKKKPLELDKISFSSSISNTSHLLSQTCCLQLLSTTMGNQQQRHFLFQKRASMSRLSLSGIWRVEETLGPLNSKEASQRNPYCPQSNMQKSWGINIGDVIPSQSEGMEFAISIFITNVRQHIQSIWFPITW